MTTTISQVRRLQEQLADTMVLSVYFTARASDPAQRNNWRARLKKALRTLAAALETASAAERRQFAAARQAFERLEIPDATRAAGVACFVTAEGTQHVAYLPGSADLGVFWTRGITLSPWVRAARQDRPVILAVADGQSARILRYSGATLSELEQLHVEPHLRQPTHMSAPPMPGFHPGTRGVAGQDQAQREWAAALDRMAHRLARQVAHHAGNDAWVILGSRPDVVNRTLLALPKAVRDRAGEYPGVGVHSADHELLNAARKGASSLRALENARALQRLAERDDERHATAVGENAARRALDRSAVAHLYVSPNWLSENAPRAEAAVQSALRQGADIEAVDGAAITTLDAMGGIAARLRYPLTH